MAEAKQKRNIWAVALMLILLAVLPVISYIYMKKGYDYQFEARSELAKLGPAMELPELTFFGDTLVGADMGKQVQLLAYFDPKDKETLELSGKYFGEIHEQFNDAKWFRMDLLVPSGREVALKTYQEEHKMDDAYQVFFYKTNKGAGEVNQSLYIKAQDVRQANFVALADTTGTVLNTYDLSDGKQFVRLIEHIAILRPAEKKEKALFRREREL